MKSLLFFKGIVWLFFYYYYFFNLVSVSCRWEEQILASRSLFPPTFLFPLKSLSFQAEPLTALPLLRLSHTSRGQKKKSCYTLPSSGGWRNYSGEWACLLPPRLDDLTCGPINPRVIDEPFYVFHNSQLFKAAFFFIESVRE